MSGSYNRKDHLYHKAKSDGYRSRAAYKLEELNKRYGILKHGFKVLDLGAWPGGWMQIASRHVGYLGKVVGIDLAEIEAFDGTNIKVITGDVRDEENLSAALEWAGGRFDVVISDMSPKLSGIKEADRYGAVACAELAIWAAHHTLRSGGNVVIKVFKGNETEEFVKSIRPLFNKVARVELDSTRKTSNEFYIAAFGFKSTTPPHQA